MSKLFLNSTLLLNRNTTHLVATRNFFQWINIVFNKVDEQRRKQFGPDRTCAEWLLRNGAAVKWRGTVEYLSDYNSLPLEGTRLYIEAVDATGSSIIHYGFKHFEGCKYINRMVLHNCQYLEDEAMGLLTPLNGSLKDLQVSACHNMTSKGLLQLRNLTNLSRLLLYNFPYVKDKEAVLEQLRKDLPQCDVEYK